jgi:predicted phage terminase large subunit-like protein
MGITNLNIPDTVQDRLNDLATTVRKLAYVAKTEELSQQELTSTLESIKKVKQEYRVLRSEYDVLYFAYEYFSDTYNIDNDNNLIPDIYTVNNAPDFHGELCGFLNTLNDNITQRICWSVPRGHAKSAYLSNIFPVHQIIYKKRHYILVVSETESMSQKFIEWISGQLKYNKKLREDFGELLHANKMANDTDNTNAFVTTTNILIQSASIGKQLRGARHGAYRPDLVILDDLESSKNTNTKELREKNLHWFNSVIMPIGDITRTAYIYMGTLVHGQGLLPAVMNRSDFRSKLYSAILSEPVRQDLWDELDTILRDVENEDREEEADRYYWNNKEAMDEGALTLWNDRFTYYELMKIKVNVGSRAFGSEYLNRPTDDETAIFKSSYIQYYDDKDLYYGDGRPMNFDIYSFWDLAVGKNDRADYNAIITVGRDRRTGVLYVLDAWIKKVPMHIALEESFKKIQEYRPKVFGVETIQAQYEMYRQLQVRVTKEGLYGTRVKPINPRGRKEDRIETLEPLIEQGTIRFKQNQRLLIEMLIQYPTHDHDDGIDALASVVDLAGKQRKRSYYNKPKGY